MGRKPKEDGEGSARKGSNFDPAATKAFVDRVFALKATKQVFKDECKAQCETVNTDIAEVYAEAEKAGIAPAYLKTAIKRREMIEGAEALDEKFAGKKRDEYHALLLALGELGQAAIAKEAA